MEIYIERTNAFMVEKLLLQLCHTVLQRSLKDFKKILGGGGGVLLERLHALIKFYYYIYHFSIHYSPYPAWC